MDCLKKIPLIIFDEVLIKIRNIKDSFVKFSSQCNIIINEMNSLLGGDNEIIKTVKKNLIRKENLNIDPFTGKKKIIFLISIYYDINLYIYL